MSRLFRDHEPLIAPAPPCQEKGRFYYREKKLSFTKPEEVYNRARQAAKKGRGSDLSLERGIFNQGSDERIAGADGPGGSGV